MATLKFKNTDGTWKAIPVTKGKNGQSGSTPTVSISVEYLTADKSATITQTGTAASKSIKIGIPNGSDGDVTKLYAKGGNRGTLNGYEVPTVASSNITVNQSSNDGIQVTNASTITVANGTENTSWTKTVHIKDESSVIELGDSWVWSGGESPTVLPNSVLVCHWSHDNGIAKVIEGDEFVRTCVGTLLPNASGASLFRNGVKIQSLEYNVAQEVRLAVGDEIIYEATPATYTINSTSGITLVESAGSLVVTSVSNGFHAEFNIHPM